MSDYAAARVNMIESQVRPNGITDRRIISAMERVPREEFVPESRRAVAYVDEDVPLFPVGQAGGDRYLIEAMAFARLLQHATIRPTDRVLMVGAGTGYGAAVVSALAKDVVALESDAVLAAEARRNLAAYDNVTLLEGPLEAGASQFQPFDAIVLEGRAGDVPEALVAQLADGGRLLAICGETDMAKAMLYTMTGKTAAAREIFDASVAALPGLARRKPAFVF
jgi:protein-L-isoaspartate(D-aspartate) O-methyltransferase